MAWRLAKSLVVFRDELNTIAPNRSKRSDGTIGDAAHAASSSDHNENDAGVVCAFDATHDPANGADMAVITERLRRNPPRALKYMIFNRRICSRRNGWKWVYYSGPSAHTEHAHFSAGEGSDGHSTGPYDDTSPWGLLGSQPAMNGGIMLPKQDDKNTSVGYWQGILNALGYSLTVDDDYGPKTTSMVRAWHTAYLKRHGSTAKPVDGKSITPSIARELQTEYFAKRLEGKFRGERGPAGPAGPAGKDGVLRLPASVAITGQVTAIDGDA